MRNLHFHSLFACVAGLGGLGCVPDFDDNTSAVGPQRVLAIRAEPAEPRPGAVVRMSALVASDVDEDSTDELSWSLCTRRRAPTEAGPVAQECVIDFGTESEALTTLGDGANVELTLPSDTCRRFGPLPPPVEGEAGVSGQPAAPDQTGGYYQPVLVGWTEEDADQPALGAVRLLCGGANVPQEELIKFNSGYRPNENPVIERVVATVDDAAAVELDLEDDIPAGTALEFTIEWAECPDESECGDGLCTVGENATVCADDCRTEPVVGCTGAEQYLLADPQSKTVVERQESIEVSWYSTLGEFDYSTTDNEDVITQTHNRWVAPNEPGPVRMWFVVRDSRRGTTWQDVTLNIVD